ncbi:hypothetical protein K469DRAFT_588636, partial [Zopfia rhizophila CBS 207.26]
WTAENDRKLLILTQGRSLMQDDYNQLVTAFPGTNFNGVRIRVSKLRVEQRKMYEELGWTLHDAGTPSSKSVRGGGKCTPNASPEKKGRKRAAKVMENREGGEDDDEATATKKAKQDEDVDLKTISVKEEDMDL